ncbi:MAG: histidine--tRNA ligase [Bdellovibrionota bacterium]
MSQSKRKLVYGEKIQPRRLKGFQDYPPEVMRLRLKVMDDVRRVAELSRFQPIGTGALEYAEVLLGQGAETDKQLYRFEDQGKRDIGLRFDLTVPFARYVAEHQGTMVFPFKRLQIGDVWRAEKPQKGRYREFCQCDLDIIGVDSLAADVEILSCFQNILSSLNVGAFTQSIGHRQILSALIRSFFPEIEADGEQQVLIAIDKLDKIGPDKVILLLQEVTGGSANKEQKLIELLLPGNSEGTDLGPIYDRLKADVAIVKELRRLEKTVELVRSLSSGNDGCLGRVQINLSVARGLGYYTGIVFETVLDELPAIGSISSGGRYNNLAERFTTRLLPGVGGSLGLDRLVGALIELKRLDSTSNTGVFVAIANDGAMDYGFGIVKTLRNANISVDLAMKAGKIGNQFKLAERLGVGSVIIVGELEKENKTFSLKNLITGQEKRDLPLFSLITTLAES